MGATLAETLAEIAAEQEASQVQAIPRRSPSTATLVNRNVPTRGAPRAAPKAPTPNILQRAISAVTPMAKEVLKDQLSGDPNRVFRRAGSAALAGLARAPGQMVGGLEDTAGDAAIMLGGILDPNFIRSHAGDIAALSVNPMVPLSVQTVARGTLRRTLGASAADAYSLRSTLGQVGYKGVNQFAAEAGASVIPMVGAEGVAARVVTAGIGSALATSADNMQQRGVNAVLGAALEGGGELVMRGGQAIFKRGVSMSGTPEEAALDALDRDFATVRTDEARGASMEETPKDGPTEAVPQSETPGTRVADAPEATPSVRLAASADTALERAGAAERIPEEGPTLTSTGKIVVSPESYDQLQTAGLARAFAAENEDRAAIIFKETASDGSSRPVGAWTREDFDQFATDVESLKANPEHIDLPAGSTWGQWKISHLGSQVDTPAFLSGIVQSLPRTARVMSDDELMDMAASAADHFGSTSEDALAFAREIAGDVGDVPTALKALQTIWKRMGDDLDTTFSQVPSWADVDEATFQMASQQIHDAQLFSSAFQDAKAEAGRGLRSLSLPDADTYRSLLKGTYKDASKAPPVAPGDVPALPRTPQEMEQWLGMWDALKDDPAARAEFLNGIRTYPKGGFYLRTAIANHFTGMILSGPKTILLNVIAPTVMGTLRTLERTAGGMLMQVSPLATAAMKREGMAIAAQAPLTFVQATQDIAAAFKSAARTFKDEKSLLAGDAGYNPVDLNSKLNIPQPFIEAAKRDGNSALPYHLGNLINWFPAQVWRLHGTTNEVALSVAYMGEVRAKANLEAFTNGLKGDDANAFVQQRLREATVDGAATDADTLASATRTTMMQAPDPTLQPNRTRLDAQVQSWRQNIPELRFLLPIYQVPANSLGESLRRIPGAGFLLKETREELSGTFGTFRQAEAHGRVVLGAGFLSWAAIQARQGVLTGAGPQDPTDKANWLNTHQPYSFRMGDHWVAYDRLEPVAPLLALAAGYLDDTVYRDTDKDMSLAAVGALAQYFKDKAAVQGISDIMSWSGDPRDQGAIMKRLGSTIKGMAVPAFLQPIRTEMDGAITTKRNPWDYIRDALPGVSRQLAPIRNLMGEVVHQPRDTLTENLLPITTSRVNTWAEDPVMDELDRIYQATGYVPGLPTTSGGSGSGMDLRDIQLEDKFSLYDALMRERQVATVDGLTLRQTLTDLITSPEYVDAPDGTASVVTEGLEGPRMGTKGGLMQQAISPFTKQAQANVAARSPIARRALAVADAKRLRNDVLRGTPARDLIRDPSLLEALGLDIESFEQNLTEGAN